MRYFTEVSLLFNIQMWRPDFVIKRKSEGVVGKLVPG